MGTFTNANDNYEVDEFIKGESKENESTFIDSYGNRLIYTGSNQFTFINSKNKSFTNEGKVIYDPSLLEIRQKQLKQRIQRYKKMKELGSPIELLEDIRRNITNTLDDISKMLGEEKILTSECAENDLEY